MQNQQWSEMVAGNYVLVDWLHNDDVLGRDTWRTLDLACRSLESFGFGIRLTLVIDGEHVDLRPRLVGHDNSGWYFAGVLEDGQLVQGWFLPDSKKARIRAI